MVDPTIGHCHQKAQHRPGAILRLSSSLVRQVVYAVVSLGVHPSLARLS